MPQNHYFKLLIKSFRFILLVSTHRADYIITNKLTQHVTSAAEEKSGIRWMIEQFHCESKQIANLAGCL